MEYDHNKKTRGEGKVGGLHFPQIGVERKKIRMPIKPFQSSMSTISERIPWLYRTAC